jgi:hypothetical protein
MNKLHVNPALKMLPKKVSGLIKPFQKRHLASLNSLTEAKMRTPLLYLLKTPMMKMKAPILKKTRPCLRALRLS